MHRLALIVLLGLGACAHGTNPAGALGSASGPEVVRPPDEDAKVDLLELALSASGYAEPEMGAAREQLDRMLRDVVEPLRGIRDEDKRARALLSRLHAAGGGLVEYDARATTLREILEEGRYNCLSASVLYNMAAERLGLSAWGELLPTHARTLVHVATRKANVVVETTSRFGYDPTPEVQQEILGRVSVRRDDSEGRALVPAGGTHVSNRVLVGAMFVNRASIAQEAGELELATELFAAGEGIAPDAGMRRILKDQRAALLSQLAATDSMSEEPERIERGYQTMQVALRLEPHADGIREVIAKNLRASAERFIVLRLEQGREPEARAALEEIEALLADDEVRAGLSAFAWSEVSRVRARSGDIEGAVEAIDRALAERLAPSDAMLAATLEQNRVAALRLAANTRAKAGDEKATARALARLESLPGLGAKQRAQISEDRLHAHQLLGQAKYQAKDYAAAARIYREGLARFPRDSTLTHNLVSALQRLAAPLVEEGRCEEAEVHLRELTSVSTEGAFAKQAEVRCLLIRANQRVAARDYEEASGWLDAALRIDPSDPVVIENLALVLLHWTRSDPAAACPKALERLDQISQHSAKSTGYARQIRARCAG